MDEAELKSEIMDRTLRLARLKGEPVRIFNDDGVREFQFGPWHFRVIFYVPQFWSLAGPQLGDVKVMLVQRNIGFSHFNTADDGRPFCLNMEYPDADGNVWWIKQDTCEQELLPYLRNYMLLDDLAGLAEEEINEPAQVD